ncbi:hypothetical protein [Parasutterella secunda]|uniref:Uncharacterized protein n=1 Tax=Parasutterella secunda TaxID=626947 RepID=A0ABS2GT27_9BURK|nr:hypothetical protein [Parasutterella secunda]MBM6928594.1 hypothetical protein [Parasutterella secunda]
MSWFKDLVQSDVEDVFLNSEEFAEEHVINGDKVRCILDKVINEAHSEDSYVGVFVNQLKIYVRTGDILTPEEGDLIQVDGSNHIVQSVNEEMGVLVIVADANKQ